MKKLFILPVVVVACVVIVSCSAEFEGNQIEHEKSATEARTEILNLAEDYGLCVAVEGNIASLSEKDLLRIESLFYSITSSMTSYDVNCSLGGTSVEMKQQHLKTGRKRVARMYEGTPGPNTQEYSCSFTDPTGYRETTLSHNLDYRTSNGDYISASLNFICTCSATWLMDTIAKPNVIANVNIIPSVRCELSHIGDERFIRDITVCTPNCHYYTKNQEIDFSGDVDCMITINLDPDEDEYFNSSDETITLTVYIGFSGSCGISGGSITWYTNP